MSAPWEPEPGAVAEAAPSPAGGTLHDKLTAMFDARLVEVEVDEQATITEVKRRLVGALGDMVTIATGRKKVERADLRTALDTLAEAAGVKAPSNVTLCDDEGLLRSLLDASGPVLAELRRRNPRKGVAEGQKGLFDVA